MRTIQWTWLFLTLLTSLRAGTVQRSEFVIGQDFYAAGEFKKAAAHFQLAAKANPGDADSYFWLGRSYRGLADISFPFAGHAALRARLYLTRATELAPDRPDCRRELFNLLLDSVGSSRTALRQAAAILQTVSADDPDYESMHRQFSDASKDSSSAQARLGRVLLAFPQAAYRLSWFGSRSLTPLQ
jgi:tetratricopeptide (TPR) repeat protein